ncbi:MAG: cytidine deaminase [Lachnospiraceae bacterium]|nr:cytidine deaminase [Lachnospiraceae bacterium]
MTARETKIKLMEKAIEARKHSYAPYSGYKVGAALLCEDGSIVTGCNVENASYGATNCGERTAVFKAVSEGKKRFSAIAIAGGKEGTMDYACPCGICRQVLREFSNPKQMEVFICKTTEDYKEMTLEELLPESFGPENLQ